MEQNQWKNKPRSLSLNSNFRKALLNSSQVQQLFVIPELCNRGGEKHTQLELLKQPDFIQIRTLQLFYCKKYYTETDNYQTVLSET